MEGEITLEALAAWHEKRAQDCLSTMARATHMPKREQDGLTSMAKFHQAAVRLLQSFEGGDLKRH
jgi:hypothetical protein